MKAKKEAAENMRKYKVNKEPPPPGTTVDSIIKNNEAMMNNNNNTNNNNANVKKEEEEIETGVDTPTNDEEEVRDVCSDVEDDDVIDYINNQEQAKLKRVIWSEMNKDYLQSQAAKEANKDAARDPNLPPKRKYNTKKKEEKYQRAENAAVAAQTVLIKKRGVSSKINYEALQSLFNEKGDTKKKKSLGTAEKAEKSAPKEERPTPTTKVGAPLVKKVSVGGTTAKRKREKEDLPAPAAAPAKKTATKPVAKAAAAVAEKMKGKKKAPPQPKEKPTSRSTRATSRSTRGSQAISGKKFIRK